MAMDLLFKADLVAEVAHAAVGQVRKYTGEPYIVHPRDVAHIVKSFYPTDLGMECAALLHDVVEDTHITVEFIRKEFNDDIADLVSDLTNVSVPEDGDRNERKRIDCIHTAAASERAQLVKCADLIHNIGSIIGCDPDFASRYLREQRLTLDCMGFGVRESEIWGLADRMWAIAHE